MFSARFTHEGVELHLPRPTGSEVAPRAFVLLPACVLPAATLEQWLYQQWLLQRAFEEAQAVVRPSILERDLLAVWN